MKEYDVYRDSLLRYLGYANEVGEAFRPLWKRQYVQLTYVVSMGYVLADTIDKGNKESKRPGATSCDVAIKSGDVLLWQTFASVIIPGFTINRIAMGTNFLVCKLKIPHARYVPTAVGLLSIPFIIHPIDHLVDYVMDNTYRTYVKK